MNATITSNKEIYFNWYADSPVGFLLKEEARKRLSILTIIIISLLTILLISYVFIARSMTVAKPPKKTEIAIDIKSIPAPPTQVRSEEKKETGRVVEAPSLSKTQAEAVAVETEEVLSQAIEDATSSLLGDLASAIPSTGVGLGSGSILDGVSAGGIGDVGSGLGAASGFSDGGLGRANVGGIVRKLGSGGGRAGKIGGPGKVRGGVGVSKGNLNVSGKGNLAVRLDLQDLKVGSGGRSASQISSVVQKSRNAIQKCYEEARVIDGNFEGSILLVVSILPPGTVKNVQVGKASFKSDVLKRCIVKIFRRMKFNAISKATIQRVQIPYNFRRGG